MIKSHLPSHLPSHLLQLWFWLWHVGVKICHISQLHQLISRIWVDWVKSIKMRDGKMVDCEMIYIYYLLWFSVATKTRLSSESWMRLWWSTNVWTRGLATYTWRPTQWWAWDGKLWDRYYETWDDKFVRLWHGKFMRFFTMFDGFLADGKMSVIRCEDGYHVTLITTNHRIYQTL